MNLMFWKRKAPVAMEQGMADDDRTVAISRDETPTDENIENQEGAVRPGFLARLRNTLSALRKPKDPVSTEGSERDDDRTVVISRDAVPTEDGEAGTVRPGLLARLRNTLSALRKPGDSGSEAGTPGSDGAGTDDRRNDEEPVVAPVRNLKKRLIIGGALGFMILLVAGVGLTTWKLLPANKAEQHEPSTAQNSAAMQAQIEALKKQNEQMHSQLEALKKTGQSDAQLASGAESDPATAAGESVMVFSGKDPKASAQALKLAIEAMNAESDGGRPARKTEK